MLSIPWLTLKLVQPHQLTILYLHRSRRHLPSSLGTTRKHATLLLSKTWALNTLRTISLEEWLAGKTETKLFFVFLHFSQLLALKEKIINKHKSCNFHTFSERQRLTGEKCSFLVFFRRKANNKGSKRVKPFAYEKKERARKH